tara:strand:+ start:70 stop:279 length:210 start_codon:yes stop_codon:yes gene_type:complete
MEGLLNRYDGKSMGLYDYSQFGGKDDKKNKKDKCEKYNNFKELYLKTKKELDEANKKIEKLEEKLSKNK